MFRKIAHLVLVMLLLVATGGMPVTRHFCGNVQKSVSLYSTPKSCCGGHCDKCHNVFTFTKVNDDFVSGSSISTPALTEITTLQAAVFTDTFSFSFFSLYSDIKSHREDFNHRAGYMPALLGNFRC